MNTQLPSLGARISAVERMQTILHARIEEVSEDITTSIKQLKDYQIQTEHKIGVRVEELSRDMTASFKQLVAYQIQTERTIDARFDKIEGDIAAVNENIVTMEAKMATKEDMTMMEGHLKGDMTAMEGRLKGDMVAMETRILDAFKQLLTVIDTRLPQ